MLTKTGHELEDVGRTLSWRALGSFVSNLSPDSALAREINPKISVWATQAKTNAILADLFDLLAMINANLVAVGSGKRARKPKRYDRPIESDNTKKLGSNSAMPRDEMVAWIEERRAKARKNAKIDENA